MRRMSDLYYYVAKHGTANAPDRWVRASTFFLTQARALRCADWMEREDIRNGHVPRHYAAVPVPADWIRNEIYDLKVMVGMATLT